MASAAKRFKGTAKGRVKRGSAFTSHILTKKSPKRKRNLRGTTMLAKADEQRVKRLLAN
ncbi:MAG TPA: 50S ribosomal protein L35 [Longimicrobium sp.]|nr:50S ribosomal protein L35 [Longimicrobium sp.]